MMATAHSIRIATANKYDIVDSLEMEPLRRRMLVASILVESEDAKNKKKIKRA
ncbi:hypothetical protein [Planococcus faecalis]|uniref:hypothetical protein n=1 Tax=Planococcus faecalis TaxID=1598147 RepID=UPI0014732894|nr:hypothetical protein [Planococcus faecalis]